MVMANSTVSISIIGDTGRDTDRPALQIVSVTTSPGRTLWSSVLCDFVSCAMHERGGAGRGWEVCVACRRPPRAYVAVALKTSSTDDSER